MRLICLLFVIIVAYNGQLISQTLLSPDEYIRIEFPLTKQSRHNYPEGTLAYAVSYKGNPFFLPSRLGFDVLGTAEIKSFLKVTDVLRTERRSAWKVVFMERYSKRATAVIHVHTCNLLIDEAQHWVFQYVAKRKV